MAEDLATLSLGLENAQTVARAKETAAAFDAMGVSGMNAAKNITLAATPVEQAILREAKAAQQAAGMMAGYESNAVAGAVAITHLGNAQQTASRHAADHTLNLGRVSRGLEIFAVNALGANHEVGLLATAMAHMEVGEMALVGGLAAVTAGIFVWEAWTDGARKAKEEQDRLTKSLEDWLGKQDEFARSIDAEKAKVEELRKTKEKVTGGGFGGMLAAAGQLDAKAWIRVLTSGPTGMVDQLATEVANGMVRVQHEITTGEEAIAAATKKVNDDAKKKAKEAWDERVAAMKAYYAEENRLRLAAAAALKPLVDKAGADAKAHADERERIRKLSEDQFYAGLEREEHAQAEQLRRNTQLFDQFFRGILENGVRNFTDLFRYIATGFENLVATLASKKLAESMAGFIGTAAVGGASATGAGGSILGGIGAAISAHPYVAAGVAVAGLVIGLLGLKSSADEARKEHERLTDAYKANIATIRTLLGQASPLDKELADLKNQFNDLRTQAKGLVDTFDPKSIQEYSDRMQELNSLEAQRAKQLQQQAAQDKQYYEQDLQARLLAAQGHQEEADDLDFLTKQQREYSDAVRAGKDAIDLASLAEVQRAETIARSIAKLQTQINAYTATIDGLKSFKDALLLSDAAGLSPAEKLAEAQRQYAAVLGAAQGGDQSAAGRLPQAAQALLDAAKQMFASGPQFQEILQQVLADTDATIQYYDDQRTIAQQQLDELKKILDAIHLQTEEVKKVQNPRTSGSGGDSGDGGTGNNGDTKGGPTGDIGTLTQILSVQIDALTAAVKENTAVTRKGFELAL